MWLYGAAHPVMFLKREKEEKGREGRKGGGRKRKEEMRMGWESGICSRMQTGL